LCFVKRFSKQNSVIRLKSNILAPPNSPQNFCAGYATALVCVEASYYSIRICAIFNHRKKMKPEPIQLIARKHTANFDILIIIMLMFLPRLNIKPQTCFR